MLVELTVNNYRSFRDRQTWSMVADPDLTDPEVSLQDVPRSSEKILPSAIVYGPNASGKTNLLRALGAMQDVVLNSARGQRGDAITPVEPFHFDEESRGAATELEVVFVNDETQYRFGFAATQERVLEEWLYASPKGEEQEWFVRDETSRSMEEAKEQAGVHFGSNFRGEMQVIKKTTRPNALVLSTASQLNNEKVAPVFDWFRERVKYLPGSDFPPLATLNALKSIETKPKVLDLLHKADLGIEDVYIKEKPHESEENPVLERLTKAFEGMGDGFRIVGREAHRVEIRHRTDAGADAGLKLDQESQGTQRYFALTGPILNALENGQVLVVDELDSSLHPMMVRAIVQLFHNEKRNPNGGQLLFNTHDTTLLEADLFRRDQIWFTEKFDDGASELYALLEFEEPEDEKTRSLATKYFEGMYGAVPILRH